MPATLYASATRTQWFANAYPGTSITPNCVVWHTTETGGWPSYGGGASAPHFTYNPAVREIRQHFPVNRSARALRNLSGGVETNTLNVVQIEIIAYSDEVLAAQRGHRAVSELRPEHLADLGDWARWLHDEWDIRLDIDPGWVTSNYTNPKRMSFAQWRGFYGHTGHNRVPENTHWDPARLDIWTIIDHARGDDDMPTAKEVVDELLSRRIEFPGWTGPDGADLYEPGTAFRVDSLLAGGYAHNKLNGRKVSSVAALLKAQQPLLEAAAQHEGLSAEQVAEIAQAVAAAVPDDLAVDVVDELHERLTD